MELSSGAHRAAATKESLTLHASRERLNTLLAERDKLLEQITKKKRELEEAIDLARRSADEFFAKMMPLIERQKAVADEIRQLFDELLAPGRLSARARKEVARVRRFVMEDGGLDTVLSDPDRDDADADAAEDGPPRWSHNDSFGNASNARNASNAGHARRSGTKKEVASANPRGQAKGQESVRSIFKRLARALHPDHAREEQERSHRTEVMKEVTRAYEEGDLARLIDLEKRWGEGESSSAQSMEPGGTRAAGAGNDDRRRCEEIERVNRALRGQISVLNRELREVRRAARASPMGDGMPIAFVMDQAEDEIEELEVIRDFVKSFRDGKISLKQLIEGPEQLMCDEDEEEDDLVEIENLINDLGRFLEMVEPRPSSARTRKRKRKGQKRSSSQRQET